LLAGACVVALIGVADVIYTFAGSKQWELVGERNGVRVYSMKTPGSALKQFKGTVRVRSTLAGVIAQAADSKTMAMMGTYNPQFLGGDQHLQYVSFRMDTYPRFLFRPREHVFGAVMYQNPRTREVLYLVRAAPDKLPPNDCCFRVTNMNNSWRFTPVENDEVEIEWTINEDLGGFMPALVQNSKWPKLMFSFLPMVKENVGKYQAARVAFIKE
jgi:hypothetical protein